jgi:hypothetical protein
MPSTMCVCDEGDPCAGSRCCVDCRLVAFLLLLLLVLVPVLVLRMEPATHVCVEEFMGAGMRHWGGER